MTDSVPTNGPIEIVAGQVTRLGPRVQRITAGNAGLMTGPGTNTYLIGNRQIAVLDPGPADPCHIKAILSACGDRLTWIVATHTHKDHSPAAQLLAQASGATIIGNTLIKDDGFQDETFKPQRNFSHNECLSSDEFTLRAIKTPGHVGNHLCFLLEEDGMLFTGDHIMQGATVVIIPPHGDMKDYIQSLQLLRDYSLNSLAPGHGYLIDEPIQEIDAIIAHRLRREAKVLAELANHPPAPLNCLTAVVYDDVDPQLHAIAQYSLWAHLIKLQKEGRVHLSEDNWCLI